MFNMTGVLSKAEARDVSYCCCRFDSDCANICRVPAFHCSNGLCICGKSTSSQDQIAETFNFIN